MLGVVGVLLTERGKEIKKEIFTNLYMHKLLAIEQTPPGKLAEYPALNYAIKLSLETHEPVLYLHTKGAFNKIPFIPKIEGRKSIDSFMPKNASLEDWQPTVRKMWYNEFGKNVQNYLKVVDTNKPTVACPYSGPGKATWQNGFIMNYEAAKELSKIFKYTENRYWYEVMFKDCKNVNVVGLLNNAICYPMNDTRFEMYKSIWSFFSN